MATANPYNATWKVNQKVPQPPPPPGRQNSGPAPGGGNAAGWQVSLPDDGSGGTPYNFNIGSRVAGKMSCYFYKLGQAGWENVGQIDPVRGFNANYGGGDYLFVALVQGTGAIVGPNMHETGVRPIDGRYVLGFGIAGSDVEVVI